jgi:hypothetical protein
MKADRRKDKHLSSICREEASIVLLTGFYVDNAHLIPLFNQLPQITFWVLPTVIGIPFIIRSISRFAPKMVAPSPRSSTERK